MWSSALKCIFLTGDLMSSSCKHSSFLLFCSYTHFLLIKINKTIFFCFCTLLSGSWLWTRSFMGIIVEYGKKNTLLGASTVLLWIDCGIYRFVSAPFMCPWMNKWGTLKDGDGAWIKEAIGGWLYHLYVRTLSAMSLHEWLIRTGRSHTTATRGT